VSAWRILAGPALLWAMLVGAALWARPLMPVDETRYLSVAWEMWQRGDWLVPHLNGQPYSHKPPLLFWLIGLGWWLGGVSELWGRLVAPLFGLANLTLTLVLGRLLWPARTELHATAPWLLLGGLWWAAYTTLTMFDMLVTCFALVGLIGVAQAARGRSAAGWAVFAFGVAGGVLSKGPVILVFLLPPALLAPLWAVEARRRWAAWYGGLAIGLLAGAALALAWALPAAQAGGPAYGDAILWGQTGGRVVKSFAHRRAAWFYLAVLPALLLPWLLWPPLWRGAVAAWRQRGQGSPGARFCAVSIVLPVLVLSLVSGKQPQYLMPLLPLIALAMAAALAHDSGARRLDGWLPAVPALVAGAALTAAILWLRARPEAMRPGLPQWLDDLSLGVGLALVVAAVMAGVLARGARAPMAVAALSVAAVTILHLGARPAARPAFDLAPVAAELAQLEQAGRPLAIDSEYHGQFHFLGRLTRPIAVVPRAGLGGWATANPQGAVIVLERVAPSGLPPRYRQAYRGRALAIRDAGDFKP